MLLEPAPMLAVTDDGVFLDGSRLANPAEAELDLVTLRRNWDVLHPRERFPGTLVVLAGRDARFARMRPYLLAAARAGYPHLQLAVQAL